LICYYLDSSAWAKYYKKELGSPWITTLFEGKQDNILASSVIGYIEVLSALSNKRVNKEIDQNGFDQKAMDLEKDWNGLVKVNLSDDVIQEAKRFLLHSYLKGADTIHLSSAIYLQKQITPECYFEFVTSDGKLKTAAKSFGLKVIDPQEI
jgi:predicted nucleic acid-binding protein